MGLFKKKPKPIFGPAKHVMEGTTKIKAAMFCPSMNQETRLTRKRALTGSELESLSVPTLMFENQGTPIPNSKEEIPKGFTITEQVLLRQAMQDCAECAELAFQASTEGFEDYMDKVELWFGMCLSNGDIKKIMTGVYELRRFFKQPSHVVKFMDVRQETTTSGVMNTVCSLLNRPGPAPLPYGARPNSITVFISDSMFSLSINRYEKMAMIFHELSHQLLGATDINKCGVSIMDKATHIAQLMLTSIEGDSINLATSWGNFMASFSQSENEFDQDIGYG